MHAINISIPKMIPLVSKGSFHLTITPVSFNWTTETFLTGPGAKKFQLKVTKSSL